MQKGLYVGLSAQVALDRRLDTLAHNVANANTVGFRATRIRFEEALKGAGAAETSFVQTGGTYVDERAGSFVETGGKLDFAVKGNAWFGVNTDAGMIMTRDGRFTMTEAGELLNVDGDPVLDAGGGPIQLDPAAGPPVAGKDGSLYQRGRLVAALGLFEFNPGNQIQRYGASGVVPAETPQPVIDRRDIGVLQGFVEQSNVNPVEEMTRLITLHRTFDSVASMLKQTEDSLGSAVRMLGGK